MSSGKEKLRIMKVTVNIPGKGKWGGVLSHYEGIRQYLISHSYRYYSNGNYRSKAINFLLFPIELLRFIIILKVYNPDVVVLNPSLYPWIFFRDSLYLKASKLLGKTTLIFFHGWYNKFQNRLNGKKFHYFYGKADSIIVLSNNSKQCLLGWGFTNPIHITSTKVNDHLLADFKISTRKGIIENILFLARIESYKGVYIAIETFNLLKPQYPGLVLNIVGSGSELESVKRIVHQSKLKNINVKGFLTGQALAKEYRNADIYLLPSFNEGLPATILEAMAFGLPIISSNVGGHRDFFNHSMGRIIKSFNPIDYAKAIEEYILDSQLVRKTNIYNYEFAKEKFMASIIASDYERIITESKSTV